uniref:Complementary sex determination N-terminal domain-containing protein n=2 Tax=Timema TaxID=61471 RepID=A0A7R9E4N0_9NEOP|nr:unnamed protein product [Timema monikensis]
MPSPRSPSQRATPPPPRIAPRRSPGFRTRGRSPDRRRRMAPPVTAATKYVSSGRSGSPTRSRDRREFRHSPRRGLSSTPGHAPTFCPSQPPDFPFPRRSRSPLQRAPEGKVRAFSPPKRKLSPPKRERPRSQERERTRAIMPSRKRSRTKSPPLAPVGPSREGPSHYGGGPGGPGDLSPSPRYQIPSVDVDHPRRVGSMAESSVVRSRRFRDSSSGSYEKDMGERPVFRGPEGSGFDISELKKISVDIRRNLPGSSVTVERNIINPEDVVLVRRPDLKVVFWPLLSKSYVRSFVAWTRVYDPFPRDGRSQVRLSCQSAEKVSLKPPHLYFLVAHSFRVVTYLTAEGTEKSASRSSVPSTPNFFKTVMVCFGRQGNKTIGNGWSTLRTNARGGSGVAYEGPHPSRGEVRRRYENRRPSPGPKELVDQEFYYPTTKSLYARKSRILVFGRSLLATPGQGGVVVCRVTGEGSRPIFEREEIMEAQSSRSKYGSPPPYDRHGPMDEHRRVVAIVGDPGSGSRYSPPRYADAPHRSRDSYRPHSREHELSSREYSRSRDYERGYEPREKIRDEHFESRRSGGDDLRHELESRRREEPKYLSHERSRSYERSREYRGEDRPGSDLRMRITEKRADRHDDREHRSLEDRDHRPMMQPSPPGSDRRRVAPPDGYISSRVDMERGKPRDNGARPIHHHPVPGPSVRREEPPERFHQKPPPDFSVPPRPDNRFHYKAWDANPEYVPKGRAYFEIYITMHKAAQKGNN